MSLGNFLADENFGSWADEMDEFPPPSPETRSGYGGERRAFTSASGFGDYAERGFSFREELPLPTQPPYTAHIGNLSFDATQADISELFAECSVTSVRIVDDKLTGAPKGFGYVEFATLDGLKKALTHQGDSLQGRNIRVSVAEPPKDRQESSRDFSDWSRKGPLPDLPQQRRVSDRGGFGRSHDNMSDAGSDRGGRRAYEPASDAKSRDFSNWERKGPLSPALTTASVGREGGRPMSKDGPGYRRSSPAWGEGRSQDGSRPPRREFAERAPPPPREPTAADLDNQWRARMRPDPVAAPEVDVSAPTGAAPAPTGRPKLQLQKRTVSEADPNAPTPVSTSESKPNPFGGAKPIDSAAREREVEEKRQLAIREKKEAEEKAKAERIEKQKLEREQEEAKAASVTSEAAPTTANGAEEPVPEAPQAPQAGKNIEILRREEDAPAPEAEAAAEATAEAPSVASSTAAPSETKAEPPKEPARQQAPVKANGNWRSGGGRRGSGPGPARGGRGGAQGHGRGAARGQAPPAENAAAAAPAEPEEEGWSTVSVKPRGNRRGNQPRGYAS
ncbi:hypothetical protein AJ80_08522 [Polytolypa hystricis UAMH7299]|uniref:RRM domain-containing protein n=1 Tax=Polytolypa hystricis (strain UAMH7299) TaxID=1447883 RepID=A0A2B7X6M4_POLH7|nr:hypothetical protein AJ80_08522 [Polytolypa hystricis UAMH7299]